ncbi:hypothetical protein pipiens_016215 [Culex pipiens pipiens]|uniref:HTH CENPB-type domain-containing protein n=1 Tax=Culex pipiens pipiens TaxID=38569 RepID=A0ABD1CM76_CULPP
MVRNYVRKTCRQEWTVARPFERSVTVVAKPKLHVPSVCRRKLCSFKTVFNPAQEQQLVNYILDMCRTFYGLTPKDVRSMAYQMAKANNIPHPFNHEEKHAGTDWFYCFRKRFPNLVLRVAEPTSMARAKGFNRKSVGDYFQLVSNIFAEHFYPPDKFYNMDEFGVLTKANRVVAERGQDQVGGMVSAEKGVTTTVVFAMSAAGDFVPPMFIFPWQRMNDALKVGAPYGSTFACNPSGWSTIDTCTKWFDHFLTHTRPTKEEPVLLLFDGHKSHTKNLQLLEKARRNHVRIVSIPPHTSQKLQPCDLTLMASMNVGQAPIGNDGSEVRDEEELGVQPEQEELVDVEQVQNEQEPGGVDHLVPVELHTVEDTKDQSQIIIEKDVYFLIQDNGEIKLQSINTADE